MLNKSKKIVSLLLSCIMLIGMLPFISVSADNSVHDDQNQNEQEPIPTEKPAEEPIRKTEDPALIITDFVRYYEEDKGDEKIEQPIFYVSVPVDAAYDEVEFPQTVSAYINDREAPEDVPVLQWVKNDDIVLNEDCEVAYSPLFNDNYSIKDGVHAVFGIVCFDARIQRENLPEVQPEEQDQEQSEPLQDPEPNDENQEEPVEEPEDGEETVVEPIGAEIPETEEPEDQKPAQEEKYYFDVKETEESKREPLLQNKELTPRSLQQYEFSPRPIVADPATLRPVPEPVTLDRITVERFTIKWLSKSTGETTPAEMNRLELDASTNNLQNQQFQIDIALNGQLAYAPGTIEITIPAYIWLDRNGNEPGRLTLSVPEEGEGEADFAWRRVGNNIVITNTRELTPTAKILVQGTFRDGIASDMVDIDQVNSTAEYKGISHELYGVLNIVTPQSNILTVESNGIDASVNTHVNMNSVNKIAYNNVTKKYSVYYESPSEMPASLLPEHPEEYVYARWYVSAAASGSQPFTMVLSDQATGQYGNIILGIEHGSDVIPSADGGNSVSATIFDGYSTSAKTAYVWTAYKRSLMPEDESITLTNTSTVTVTGWDDKLSDSMSGSGEIITKVPTTYTFTKYWDDNHNAKGVRPSTLRVELYDRVISTKYPVKVFNLQENGTDYWSVSWSDNGAITDYELKEQVIPDIIFDSWYDAQGYEHTLRGRYTLVNSTYDDATHSWTYRNLYTEGTIEIPVSYLDKRVPVIYQSTNLYSTDNRILSQLYANQEPVVYYSIYGRVSTYGLYEAGSPIPVAVFEDDTLKFAGYNNVSLGEDDYQFDHIVIYNSGDYLWTHHPETDTYTADKVDEGVLSIYGKISGEWVLIATYEHGTYTVVHPEAFAVGQELHFPDNVTGIKQEYPTTHEMVYLSEAAYIKLKPSTQIKSLIESLFNQNEYAVLGLQNTAKNYAINKEGNEIRTNTKPATAYLHGKQFKVAGLLNKIFEFDDNDVINRRIKIYSQITMTQQSNIDSRSFYDTVRASGELPDSKHGFYYDLLPYHVEPDLDSVTAENGTIVNKRIIEDWQGSGRTMLIVEVEHTDQISFYDEGMHDFEEMPASFPSDAYRNQHSINFYCYYSWDDAQEHGVDNLVNLAAYESSEDVVANLQMWAGEENNPLGGNNISSNISADDAPLMTGLGDGSTDPKYLYTSAQFDANEIDFFALTTLQKQASVSGTGKWAHGRDGSINVQAGGTYSYRLYVQSAADTETTNIILFDSIENYVPIETDDDYGESAFRGLFLSVDTRDLVSAGIDPVVYYSTVQNLNLDNYGSASNPNQAKTRLQTDGNWSTTPPSDLSTVTAIAIDCTKGTDGEPFTLMPEQLLLAYIRMRAPQGDDAIPYFDAPTYGQYHELNAHAFNSVYMNASQKTIVSTSHVYLQSPYTKVGIYSNNLYVSKEWDDHDDNDGYRPESVTVHLYRNGVDTGLSAVLDETSSWEGVFYNIPKYDDNGIEYHYSIVEDDVPHYTASIRYNENSIRKNDYTVINHHDLDQTEVVVNKIWVGDEETKETTRPRYITFELYANGESTGERYTVNELISGEWIKTITKQKYDNKQEIIYTVVEIPVEDYVTTYQGNTIINEYHPLGDLSISKITQGATTAAQDAAFSLEIKLTDAAGNDLIDKYYYDSNLGQSGRVGNGDVLVIRGGETITIHDLPSKSNYELYELPKSGWTLVSGENITGSIKWGETKQALFVNRYNSSGYASFVVKKNLSGRNMSRYQFRFDLFDENNNLIGVASNGNLGLAYFARRKYTEAQDGLTIVYYIREENLGKPGYGYDDTIYRIEVTPADNGNGTMSVQTTYYLWDPDTETKTPVSILEFTNEYHANGNMPIKAWKSVSGGKLSDHQFRFVLIPIENQGYSYVPHVEPAVQWNGYICGDNLEDGTIVFDDDLYFDESDTGKTFYFAIAEINNGIATVTYDESIYGYKVTVGDNGDGTLSISSSPVSMTGSLTKCSVCGDSPDPDCTSCDGLGWIATQGWTPSDQSGRLPIFTNRYKDGSLYITKLKSGTEGADDQSFTFTVRLIGQNIPSDEFTYYIAPANLANLTDIDPDDYTSSATAILDDNGEFSITLHCSETAIIKDLASGTAYQIIEDQTDGWILFSESDTSGIIEPLTTSNAVFTNLYDPSRVTVSLIGLKTLNSLVPDQSFSFELYDEDGTLIETVQNDTSGMFRFSTLSFTSVGTYTYRIKEIIESDETIEYDDHEETVVIEVIDDGEGNLSVRTTYDEDKIRFNNRTKPGTLTIEKQATGLTDANADSVFYVKIRLFNEDGLPVDNAIYDYFVVDADPGE